MNDAIRKEIKDARLKFWEVAREIGWSQTKLYRKMNSDLTAKEKERILKAIADLKKKTAQKNLGNVDEETKTKALKQLKSILKLTDDPQVKKLVNSVGKYIKDELI